MSQQTSINNIQSRMERRFSDNGVFTDQGSIPNDTSTSQQASLNSMLNRVERRLIDDEASVADTSCTNAVSHEMPSICSWDMGESSSRFGAQNQIGENELKVEVQCPSDDARISSMYEDRQRERVSINVRGTQIRSRPLFLRGSGSHHATLSLNAEQYFVDNEDRRHNTSAILGPHHLGTDRVGIQEPSPLNIRPEASPGISGSLLDEDDGSGWGSSCKRKALEGTSGHSYSGASSSSFPEAEWHTDTGFHNTSSSLSLSTPTCNSPGFGHIEQINPRVTSESFLATDLVNSDSLRDFSTRVLSGPQLETASNSSTTGVTRSSRGWFSHQPLVPSSGSMDSRSTVARGASANSDGIQHDPHGMHGSSSSRSTQHFPWSGPSNARHGNPSGPFTPAEAGFASQEEMYMRSIMRNGEHSMYAPLPEIRNAAQNPTNWGLATGNASTSGSVPPTSMVPGSSVHPPPPPSWFSPHQPTSFTQQRFLEFAPWSLFPQLDSELGGRSVHFPPLSSGPFSSSLETSTSSGSSSRSRNHPFSRSAFFREGLSDDILGMPRSLRALATDVEGRHRLISEIRQVLTAMRRSEHLRSEDNMLFDPVYQTMADIYDRQREMQIHDRHRDMRLDVDNMSYEELLALEERIGDVSTGLSEETIARFMKLQNYAAASIESSDELEPCCICREEYADGDELGILDCGHNFHSGCIKQWLMLKNLCPICKITALPP